MLSVQKIITPSSDEWYRRESIGREMLLEPIKAPTKDILSLLNTLNREASITSPKTHELKRPLENYQTQQNALDKLIKNTLAETDFGNIPSILSAVSNIRQSLHKFIECTNKVITKIPETRSHKGNKIYASNPDRSDLEKILKIHKLILNLLTCIEFGIEINAEDNPYPKLRDEVHAAVKELKNTMQDFTKDLSLEEGDFLNKFNQLFNLIGIEEFLNTGKIPKYFNTICDLPSEMTLMSFELIKKLTGWFKDKDIQVINCYKEILLKNPSINELGILACKEVIKLKGYDAALEILNLTNNTEENNQSGINNDVLILKLFCTVELKDFESAYDIIRNISEELLIKQDDKLLFEIQQILKDKVEALYTLKNFNEIENIANNYQAIFNKSFNNEIEIKHQEFVNKVKNDKAILESLKIIFPEFNDQLAKDNDLEKENASNPSKQLEFNLKVMASDIEELKQSNISRITDFVEEYTYKQQSKISVPIGLGLILNSTIALNETELALKIIDEIELGLVLEEFSSSDIVDIMTCVDGSGYSVASTTLYSGNQKLFNALNNLIQNLDQEKIIKTKCISKDLRHLETVICCPQFEEFEAKECIENFIKPLYSETSIIGITSLIENT